MGALLTNFAALLARDADEILACPRCRAPSLALEKEHLVCEGCGASYVVDPERRIAVLTGSESAVKADIKRWWTDLYEQLYGPTDRRLDAAGFGLKLEQLEDLFWRRQHLAVVDMPLESLTGKRILEIGSGGGAHSALFKKYGASVVAIDITPARTISTSFKLSLVPSGEGRAYQADAESLPFRDGSFDIVYSNGVLHHSESTERCVAEVHRVLVPKGRAVLMLYARHSAVYWLNIVPRAIFTGLIFGRDEARWAGQVTEGKSSMGRTHNPVTRVYSERELRELLRAFRLVDLRKVSFQFDNIAIPRLSQLRRWVLARIGYPPHPGGELVYGVPFTPETPLELRLGRILGFGWNIVAEKS